MYKLFVTTALIALTAIPAKAGRTTYLYYDELNRLTRSQYNILIGEIFDYEQHFYDELGNMTRYTRKRYDWVSPDSVIIQGGALGVQDNDAGQSDSSGWQLKE